MECQPLEGWGVWYTGYSRVCEDSTPGLMQDEASLLPPASPRNDRARRGLSPARRRSRCHGDEPSGPGPAEAPGAAVEASAGGPAPCLGMRRGRGRCQPLLRGEGEGWEVVECGSDLRGSHHSGCSGNCPPGPAPGAFLCVLVPLCLP